MVLSRANEEISRAASPHRLVSPALDWPALAVADLERGNCFRQVESLRPNIAVRAVLHRRLASFERRNGAGAMVVPKGGGDPQDRIGSPGALKPAGSSL